MIALSKEQEAVKLGRIRAILAGLQGFEWLLSAEVDEYRIQAKSPDGSVATLARFSTDVTHDELDALSGALDDMRFLVGLVDRAIEALRAARPAPKPKPNKDKDYAAEAAMRCGDPAFRVFLEQKHRLERPLTDQRVEQKVRSICAVTSRRELNNDDRAAANWKQLRGEYENWKRAGQ